MQGQGQGQGLTSLESLDTRSKLNTDLLSFSQQLFVLHPQLVLYTFVDVHHDFVTIHLQRICRKVTTSFRAYWRDCNVRSAIVRSPVRLLAVQLHVTIFSMLAPCGLRDCKNRAHSVSWSEVIKGVPNQGLDCFVSYGIFLLYLFCVSGVCSVVFDCFWLSVTVQMIAWKDSSPKWPIMCRVGR